MTAVFAISPKAQVEVRTLGREKTPLLVIDHVLKFPDLAVEDAVCQQFQPQPSDFYPGQRAPVSTTYQESILGNFGKLLKTTFGFDDSATAKTILSAYSMTDTPEQSLKPIQMLPHFDSPDNGQLAMVHYLCAPKHGGTGFFRHKTTQVERVTTSNIKTYGQSLKDEAIASQLHLQPKYVNQEHKLFESIGSVEVKFNRLIIYPSNLLHSGLIDPKSDLGIDPLTNRLTISSFIKLS